MPEGSSFRFVDEKHASGITDLMVWSPKMDLIAVSNKQGEVLLYRLIWQKVWTLAAPEEEVKVTALAWRPDGKVLAIGYSNGQTILCDVENANKLHMLNQTHTVSVMSWIAVRTTTNHTDTIRDENPADEMDEMASGSICDQQVTSQFLPKLPQFSKSYSALSKSVHDENVEDSKKLKDQTDLNILVVGTHDHHICLYAFGVFPLAVVNIEELCRFKAGRVLSCHLSHDLYLLSLLVESQSDDGATKDVILVSIDTTLIACRSKELQQLALKFGHILTLLVYLDSTIQQMVDSWEDILLEIDSKLMKLAEEKYKAGGGCVSNDFLRLLMLGYASEELTQFLLMELTEKGLKKLGHSIEASYSNTQKLVLKHLQSVGQALVLHLSDICGMSKWFDKFGVLGLRPSRCQEMVQAAGAFMLKASELQQVIDNSMRNFRAFFRWLYVVIQRLSEEPVSPEFSKVTQQDLNFVAQFLKDNFIEDVSESRKQGYRLEKVGQYLHDEDLVNIPDIDGNPWVEFLKQNPQLEKSDILYKSYRTKSLIQVHHTLKAAIDSTLSKCADVMSQTMECVTKVHLYSVSDRYDQTLYRVSQYSKTSDNQTCLLTMYTSECVPCHKCYMLKQTTTGERRLEVVGLTFGQIGSGLSDSNAGTERCGTHSIQDLSFYDDTTFCALIQTDGHLDSSSPSQIQTGSALDANSSVHVSRSLDQGFALLIQAPLVDQDFVVVPNESAVISQTLDIRCLDVGSSVEQCGYRKLDNMNAVQFAVSGMRRVACVLFSTRRRVRLFMMDAEDEEDEEDNEEDNQEGHREDKQEEEMLNSETPNDEDKENTEVSL